MYVPNDEYEILTPLGFRSFRGLHVIIQETLRVFGDGACLLEGSPNHRVLTPFGYLTLEELKLGDILITQKGTCVIERIETGEYQQLFDPIDVDHPDQAFYTGDVVSHNCSFEGSANTLISAKKLAQMIYHPPLEERNGLKIYAHPVRADEYNPSHVYIATVDVSQGQELDYSVVSVFDVSVAPWRQVAVFRRNNLSPQLFAPIVRDIALHYCSAFILTEINDVGAVVADMLNMELEYANIIYIRNHPKRGQSLAGPGHKKSRAGLRTSAVNKRIGCSALRAMVEKDQLLIFDFDTIRELTTFVAHGQNWRAETGAHDDCVITLVLLGWLSTQQGFENYVGLSMRKLLANQYEPVTLDAPAMGFFDINANEQLTVVEDGDVWEIDSPNWL